MFRPPVETITHGRTSSAPAWGRRNRSGESTVSGRPATAAAAGSAAPAAVDSTPATLRGGGFRTSFGTGGRPSSTGVIGTKRLGQGPAWPGRKLGSAGALSTRHRGGAQGWDNPLAAGSVETALHRQRKVRVRGSTLSALHGGGDKRSLEGGSNAGATGEVSLLPWELGLREGSDGAGGWWPAATCAVEDGARLEIYTGSVLDGRWLNSLDSRLRSTIRATRR